MSPSRRVTVERNRLRFAAAHMATFGGDMEPLHGHNYDITVEIEGDLTKDDWVWDFGGLKKIVREIADALDHHFLLQRNSQLLTISELPDAWRIEFRDRTYTFPKQDVIALPIENTTAERISEWISGRIQQGLAEAGATNIRRLSVGVEEMPGQAGWYTVDL
ncbi:MAG: 6-pyruvoyl tetrahydropterin synthase family protein [Dehalococcoidia bacterium]|nr:6-pyruvoyl tetrahydropterin synthase family protein [Dehalococcoidia bacterium]MCB9486988.1 6-pyruvoyl tetrahydropterin synthase family protein [Thermoflexaceae bacterium]